MKAHLIYFDDQCSFCRRWVKRISRLDRRKLFAFYPLNEAKEKELIAQDTLILVENAKTPQKKIWLRGRAIARIFWLLGGVYRIMGVFSFFPLGLDLIYRFIAHHRHRL
jgi:predicted DCC family thiol-disulfide oxidoreductase YuxK